MTSGGYIEGVRGTALGQVNSLYNQAVARGSYNSSSVQALKTLSSHVTTYLGLGNGHLNNLSAFISEKNAAVSADSYDVSVYNSLVSDKSSTIWTTYNSQKSSYDTQNAAWTAWSNYDTNHKTWENELAQLENAWTAYNNSSVTETVTEELEAKNDLVEALKSNSDFLIQGILSGYLTLMKDGQEVSLAGSKEISTVYDKTDDAQAEAEYKAEMAKINRKEKALDNEMKRLDTEHSALQTELESIKAIISDHAGKDFNLFS